MKSRWNPEDAGACVRDLAACGVPEALALRVYTTRLLGRDPALVLHGGGNTSVKIRLPDAEGEWTDVLCVKGSGWDMASIEPPGLPAVRLEPLRALRSRENLRDEDMVAVHRANLIDGASPDPSVETLLHAFLPHVYVDHTHANAVLSVTNQPDGEVLAREVWGDRAAIVPYVMPGFDLAKACALAHERNPGVEGLILLQHGVFSFGETAREAYERMIGLVTLAERRIERSRPRPGPERRGDARTAARIAPLLRGLVSRTASTGDGPARLVLAFRDEPDLRWLADEGPEGGPATPDHVIRTKARPLVLPSPDQADFGKRTASATRAYARAYRAYVERHRERAAKVEQVLDPAPRVLRVPGVGVFAAGPTSGAARVAGDLVAATATVIRDAERVGSFRSLPEQDLFDVEYWSLEQAKLGKRKPRPLTGHVVVITGGAGTIGRASALAFAEEGADVVLMDRDPEALAEACRATRADAVETDLSDRDAVREAFDRVACTHGGLDILVSNAGAAWQGRIGEIDEEELHASFDINFFGHQRVAQAAVGILRAQDLGGCLLFNVSKQAVNPGPAFGAYGTAKAATLALMRQYALEYGRDGIRSNAVNADRVRSGLLTESMVRERADARGVSEQEYMEGNLLGAEVRALDVARAFVSLARQERTTAAVLTVDGGNMAAAVR